MIDEPTPTDFPDQDGATMAPPAPPPPAPPVQRRQLVRDPYSRLGGVASGIAHYYGLDVSLVRILFLLLAFTTGFGFLLYLVAWLVIPRATYWPPVGSPHSLRSLGARELGLGLAVIGLLFAIGVGSSGVAGSVLVPILLVGGGVWLLVQPPQALATPNSGQTGTVDAGLSNAAESANVGAHDPIGGTGGSGDAGGGGGSGGDGYGFASPGPAGAPVPPPSKRRRWGIIGVVTAVVLAVIAIPVLIFGLIVAAIATGDWETEFRQTRLEFNPVTVEAIPDSVSRDGAEMVIDLTSLDAADFDEFDTPVPVDAQVDFGSIRVIVPEDISVDVDAQVDIGSVTVFGDEDDGFDPSIQRSPSEDAADVDLNLEVDLGEIVVERP